MNRLNLPPAAGIGVLAAVAMIRTAAADSPVPCSGDDAACQNINITQRGTDQQSGAHFLMRFDTRRRMEPQSMILTLSIASSSDSCGSANDTYANLNPGDTRIDRRLSFPTEGNLRATLTSRRRTQLGAWGCTEILAVAARSTC